MLFESQFPVESLSTLSLYEGRQANSLSNKFVPVRAAMVAADHCHQILPQLCIGETECSRELEPGFPIFIFIHVISNCFQNKVMRLGAVGGGPWRREILPPFPVFLQAAERH